MQPLTRSSYVPSTTTHLAGAGSSWPEQEQAVARSCPWASPPDIVQALETTGGRGDDAIELLIAARNEQAMATSPSADQHVANSALITPSIGERSPEIGNTAGTCPHDNEAPAVGEGKEGDGAGLANGSVTKSAKASPAAKAAKAKKVARGADCPCRSGLKYKKCCRKKDAAIARGQIAAPELDGASTAAADNTGLANDLGSLVI